MSAIILIAAIPAAAVPKGIQDQRPQVMCTNVILNSLAGSELFFFLTAWCIIVVLPTNISVSCQSHLSAAASAVPFWKLRNPLASGFPQTQHGPTCRKSQAMS